MPSVPTLVTAAAPAPAPRELAVRVTAAAEGGKANDAVVKLLAKQLKVPKSAIRIIRGQASRHKVLEVELASEVLAGRLPYL